MIALENLEQAKETVNYINGILTDPKKRINTKTVGVLEDWERKEYIAVKEDAEERITELTELINDNYEIFGVRV